MLKTLVAEAPTVGSSDSKYRKVFWKFKFNKCRQYYEELLFLESLLITMRVFRRPISVIKSIVNRSLSIGLNMALSNNILYRLVL